LRKFKKLSKTFSHEFTHARRRELLSKVGESLGADRRRPEVMLVPRFLHMSGPGSLDKVKRDVLAVGQMGASLR
jgi:hypothetical protein